MGIHLDIATYVPNFKMCPSVLMALGDLLQVAFGGYIHCRNDYHIGNSIMLRYHCEPNFVVERKINIVIQLPAY